MTANGLRHEERIERLEQLLQILQGGAAPGQTFAGPIVANEAAMQALVGILDGEQVFVLSHRSIWTKRNGVAGTQGVPPLSPHEVDAANDGTGVFCRTMYSDPALRIGINDVFIDPANPAANDENDGLTALTPLKTGYENFRRWGWGAPVIVGPNLATSPDGFTTIHVQSNISDPDSLPMNVIVAENASLRIRGGTPTVVQPATALTGVTAMNPVGNTRLRLTAGALNWAPFIAANRRGRILTGAAAGGTFQVQTSVGAGVADCSACQTTNEPGFSIVPTTVTPAPGDTFVIESLVQCNFSDQFEIRQQNNDAFGGFDAFINLVDINVPLTPNQAFLPTTSGGLATAPRINIYNCTIDNTCDFTQGSVRSIASYYFAVSINIAGFKSFNSILAGGGANTGAGFYSIIVIGDQRTNATLDNDFVANRCNAFVVNGSVRNFASWNAQATATINTGAHAVLVGAGAAATFFGVRGNTIFKGTCWGNGGAGVGVAVAAGCDAIGPAQVVTGGGGDFKLADRTTGWFFDAAAAVYNPAAGPLAFSWVNLNAAQPGGFAGDAHNPVSDSHWVPAETSA